MLTASATADMYALTAMLTAKRASVQSVNISMRLLL